MAYIKGEVAGNALAGQVRSLASDVVRRKPKKFAGGGYRALIGKAPQRSLGNRFQFDRGIMRPPFSPPRGIGAAEAMDANNSIIPPPTFYYPGAQGPGAERAEMGDYNAGGSIPEFHPAAGYPGVSGGPIAGYPGVPPQMNPQLLALVQQIMQYGQHPVNKGMF